MKTRSYSQDIANAIHDHLKSHDFKYNFNEDRGVFNFTIGVSGKVKTFVYHIIVSDHGFTSSARYPLGPTSRDMDTLNTMARFLTRANNGLRIGNFEMDLDDGEIDYKVHCSCRGIEASDEMIAESIQCPTAMFEKYEDGILGILFRGMSDKEAAEHCENSKGSILSKLEELKARLEEMEGDKSRNEEETDVTSEDNVDDEENIPFAFDAFLRMLAEKAADAEGSGETPDDVIDAGVIDWDMDEAANQ